MEWTDFIDSLRMGPHRWSRQIDERELGPWPVNWQRLCRSEAAADMGSLAAEVGAPASGGDLTDGGTRVGSGFSRT
jgi:hypothetical protein